MSELIQNQPPEVKKNPFAVLLGRMGKGKKKTLSKRERQRRRDHLDAVRPRKRPDFVPLEEADSIE